MDQPEHTPTEAASPPKAVWETLTVAQQQTVLQTMVRICCQIAERWASEVRHEPTAER